jgi:hypothetical protein
MSKTTLLSGVVSQINYFSSTTGTVERGEGTISTSHRVSFRINNVPVTFPGTPNLAEGDMVTMAFFTEGIAARAGFFRNDTTGVMYRFQGRISKLQTLGNCCFCAGIILLFNNIIVAIPLAAVGYWYLSQAKKAKQKLEELISTN